MYKYLVIFAAIAAIVLFFNSCIKDDNAKNAEQNLKEGQDFLAGNAKREGVITTASGLQYEVLREGKEDGKTPTIKDQVRCHYQGKLLNGKVFDSSYNTNPIVFPLNGVIKGWTEGLQYMKEGAKYRLFIPYQLGYGPNGYYTIPPYAVLIFDVELIEVL